MNIKFLNLNLIRYFSFLFIFFIATIFLYFKYKNNLFSFYDTGYYFSKIYLDYKQLINSIKNNNFSIFEIPFFSIVKFLNFANIFFILQIKILFILSLLLFKNQSFITLIVYVLFPSTWIYILGEFHIDYFSIPIFYLLFRRVDIHKNIFQNKSILLILFILISIKSIYISFIFGILLYQLSGRPINDILYDKKIYIITFLILTYIISLIALKYINLDDIFELILKRKKLFDLNSLISYLIIITLFFHLFFRFNKKFLIIVPYLLFLLFFGLENYNKYYNHYLMPIIIYGIYSINDYLINTNKNNIKSLIIIGVSFFFHVIFSFSPISIGFYSKINYLNSFESLLNDDRSMEINDIKKIFEDKNIKNKKILISNNIISEKILDNEINILDQKNYKNKFDYILIKKEPIVFLGDKKCKEYRLKCKMNDKIYNEIKLIYNYFNKEYKEIYKSEYISLFENKF